MKALILVFVAVLGLVMAIADRQRERSEHIGCRALRTLRVH